MEITKKVFWLMLGFSLAINAMAQNVRENDEPCVMDQRNARQLLDRSGHLSGGNYNNEQHAFLAKQKISEPCITGGITGGVVIRTAELLAQPSIAPLANIDSECYAIIQSLQYAELLTEEEYSSRYAFTGATIVGNDRLIIRQVPFYASSTSAIDQLIAQCNSIRNPRDE